jgi:hypothetical protein
MIKTKYGIAKRTISREPFVEISSAEFEQFKDAKAKLIDALVIEEKFDFLLQNYAEYERDLLNMAFDHLLFMKMERKHFSENNNLVNRRIVNTLMSGRLYIDHLRTDVTALLGRHALKEVNLAVEREKAGSFAYRLMDKIRNYALHRSFPLQYVTYGGSWEGDPPTHARHTISPVLDVDELARDQRFDPGGDILKELQAQSGEVNLTQLLRQHMEAIGRIHLTVRRLVEEGVASWDGVLLGMKQRADAVFKPDEAFSVVKITQDKECLEEEFIIDDIVHFRVALATKNGFGLQSLSRHYVSGIIESETDRK